MALVCTTLVTTAVAQERRRHGPLFKPEALGELEGPDRDAWQMPDAVMDALRIADGSHVADIGAGGGWFTVRLARRVGPNGLVYAEDVQSQMVEAIRRRVDREGLRNVRIVRGAWVDEEPGAIGQADGAFPQRAFGCPGVAGDVSAPAVALAHAAAARVAEDFGAGDLGHEPDDTMPIVSRRDP